MKDIELSIIIPMYNSEKYIEKTLNSILAQNIGNYEVIVIDDGSSDNSYNLVLKYLNTYSHFKLIYQKNKGASFARNVGIKEAKGNYIIFFDSDDIFLADSLNKMLKQIRKYNADLLISNYYVVNEELEIKSEVKINIEHKKKFYDIMKVSPFPGNKIYKLSIIKENNIIFDNLKIGQDLNFYLKYCNFINVFTIFDDFSVKYRIVENSISNSFDGRILDIEKCMNDVRKYCVYENINNKIYLNYIEIIAINNYIYQFYKLRFFSDKRQLNRIKIKLSKLINHSIIKFIGKNPMNFKYIYKAIFSYIKMYLYLSLHCK